jgi:hypothetical protein
MAYMLANRCNEGNLNQGDFNHSRKVPNLAEEASDYISFTTGTEIYLH